jgi:hypothetical protein
VCPHELAFPQAKAELEVTKTQFGRERERFEQQTYELTNKVGTLEDQLKQRFDVATWSPSRVPALLPMCTRSLYHLHTC